MADEKTPLGPVGRNVVRNAEELRKARGLSLRDLSDRLADVGRPILSSVLHRLSQGKRRVDADDLVALSLALGVNPNALLFRRDVEWEENIELAPDLHRNAYAVWRWAQGLAPLPSDLSEVADPAELEPPFARAADFAEHALPQAGEVQYDPVLREVYDLGGRIEIVLKDFANPANWDMRRDYMIRAYRKVGLVLEELVARGDREVLGKTAFPFNTELAQQQLRDAADRVRPAVDYAPGTGERLREQAREAYGNPRAGEGAAPTSITFRSPALPPRKDDE